MRTLGVIGARPRMAMAVAILAGSLACGPSVSSRSAEVLDRLGGASGFVGGDCGSGDAMVDAYLEEIGRQPSKRLSAAVPRFARRAAKICPDSRPVIRVSRPVEAAAAAAAVGGPNPGGTGAILLEPWLRADVVDGKVVSLTVDLAKLR
jgi:hypothetical protein